MRLLVILIIATAKCRGRSLLDHSQSLSTQDEGILLLTSHEQTPLTENPISSTATTSTTLDPWEEFCKEACEEGWASQECDCPDHGFRQSAAQNHRDVNSNENSNIKSYNKIHSLLTALHKLILKSKITSTTYAQIKSSLSINKTPSKTSKNVPKNKQYFISSNNDTSEPKTTSTTLDPWDEFCREACAEGLAGPECNCADYPIG
ncbi:unnamed protein product [Meganyctiphanes norvegica]|uniref:Uncharacterized protein n=1 Tax=Meganyctiphanes norvegica TaxID=48144 RepID=A0AAV2SR21_MEGNR